MAAGSFKSIISAQLRRSALGREALGRYYLLGDIRREFESRRTAIVEDRPATTSISRPSRTLLYWPAGSDNPYQELLYCGMTQVGWQALGLRPEALFDPATLDGIERPVVHIHWSQWITHGTQGTPRSRLQRALGVLDRAAQAEGGTILSIHEPLPHEYEDFELEVEVKRELVARSTVVHAPHASTIHRAREHYDIPEEKVLIVELPTFDAIYPDVLSAAQARRSLSIPADSFVVSMIGNIKPWKGLGRVLDGHDHLRAHGVPVHTVIAGRPIDVNERLRSDMDRAQATAGCHTYFDVVPVLEFSGLVRAADVVAVPYDVMHNSAVLFTALSFDVPVLAPDTPATREAAESGLVTLYDPRDESAFAESLLRMAQRRPTSDVHVRESFRQRHDPAHLGLRFAAAIAERYR